VSRRIKHWTVIWHKSCSCYWVSAVCLML